MKSRLRREREKYSIKKGFSKDELTGGGGGGTGRSL